MNEQEPSKSQAGSFWTEKTVRWCLIPLIPTFFGLTVFVDSLLGGPRDFPAILAFVMTVLACMAPVAIPWCIRRLGEVEPIPVPGVFPSVHIPASAKLFFLKGTAILINAVFGFIWLRACDAQLDSFQSWNFGRSFWGVHIIASATVIGMFGPSKAMKKSRK